MNKKSVAAAFFGLGLAGAVAVGALAQSGSGARPGTNVSVADQANAIATLKSELAALKAQLAATDKKLAAVEQNGKNNATKGFELQSGLSNLKTAYEKHQHYANLSQMTGGKQLLSAPPSSPPTEKCSLRSPAAGDSWSGKYSCGI